MNKKEPEFVLHMFYDWPVQYNSISRAFLQNLEKKQLFETIRQDTLLFGRVQPCPGQKSMY